MRTTEFYISQSAFVGLMNALATAASHRVYESFIALNTRTDYRDGRFHVRFWRNPDAPPSKQFTYKQLFQAIKVTWDRIIRDLPPYLHPLKWECVSLLILHAGVVMAEGTVTLTYRQLPHSIATYQSLHFGSPFLIESLRPPASSYLGDYAPRLA